MQTLAMPMIIGGTALSSFSILQGGEQAAEIGKIQQQQYETEAGAVVEAGAEEARAKRDEGKRLQASQIAAISASGGGFVGSNLIIMAESARNVEMDALTIERNAQVRAKSLRTQGQWARYEGLMARRNAKIRATANILGTAGQLYLMYKYPQNQKQLNLSPENKATLYGGRY